MRLVFESLDCNTRFTERSFSIYISLSTLNYLVDLDYARIAVNDVV